MAFKRSHHRADFDSSMTASDIGAFVDDFYADCVRGGLDGVIVENSGAGMFILEGGANEVDNAMNYLNNATELSNNETYLTETSGAFFSCLASHIDGDVRNTTCS